jgi:hypothetical protein
MKKNIRDTCIEFFKNEDIKRDVKEIISPIVNIIYNEIYVYIWFICLYIVFLTFIILANLFLLLRLITKTSIIPSLEKLT